MNTQPIPTMPMFNSRVEQFRIWQPETYERNLRGATIGSVDENYLFLVCAFDYVFNPADLKMLPIHQLFMTSEDKRVLIQTDTYWTLNVSPETIRMAAAYFGGGVDVPGLPNPDRRSAIRTQGPGNYNILTKLIESCCRDLGYNDHVLSVAEAIKRHRDTQPITAAARATLVSRYNTLINYYTGQTLTGFGLIYR